MTGRLTRPLLASPHARYFANPHRGYAMFIARIVRGALKLRYILLGGAIGGGVTLQKVIQIDIQIRKTHSLHKGISNFREKQLHVYFKNISGYRP